MPATARLLPLVAVRRQRLLSTALISECVLARKSVTATVMTLMDVLVNFPALGRTGPLSCGISLAEAEDLLGPGRPAYVMKGPTSTATR